VADSGQAVRTLENLRLLSHPHNRQPCWKFPLNSSHIRNGTFLLGVDILFDLVQIHLRNSSAAAIKDLGQSLEIRASGFHVEEVHKHKLNLAMILAG